MNIHKIGVPRHTVVATSIAIAVTTTALLTLSACSSNTSKAAASTTTGQPVGSSTLASALMSNACNLLTIAQVAVLTGGNPVAVPSNSSALETSDCAYKASPGEVDISVAPNSLSPACAANGGAILVSGVGKCATYDSQLSLLTVYGATDSCSIDAVGFGVTKAQLMQLATEVAPKL